MQREQSSRQMMNHQKLIRRQQMPWQRRKQGQGRQRRQGGQNGQVIKQEQEAGAGEAGQQTAGAAQQAAEAVEAGQRRGQQKQAAEAVEARQQMQAAEAGSRSSPAGSRGSRSRAALVTSRQQTEAVADRGRGPGEGWQPAPLSPGASPAAGTGEGQGDLVPPRAEGLLQLTRRDGNCGLREGPVGEAEDVGFLFRC
jgi:hypothetical protein